MEKKYASGFFTVDMKILQPLFVPMVLRLARAVESLVVHPTFNAVYKISYNNKLKEKNG